jgi:hypothetical protein
MLLAVLDDRKEGSPCSNFRLLTERHHHHHVRLLASMSRDGMDATKLLLALPGVERRHVLCSQLTVS